MVTTVSPPRADAPTVARVRHFPALDGLRCLAFLLVFAYHAAPRPRLVERPVENAWCGVDMFFVLSGFLVSYLLFEEEVERGRATGEPRFSLWRFWVRRALRIWPLYFFAVAMGLLVLPRLAPPWTLGPAIGTPAYDQMIERHGAALWTFLFNWTSIAHPLSDSPIAVLWSVSTEEQFYVLWPLALALTPQRLRRKLIVGVMAAALLAKIPVALVAESHRVIYVNTFLRADTFMAGALIAHVMTARRGVIPPPPRWLGPAVLAGAVGLACLPPIASRGVGATLLGYVLLDGVGAGLLYLCLSAGSLPERALRWKPLTWMGTISYGLYVYHAAAIALWSVILLDVTGGRRSGAFYAATAAAALATTIAASVVSYYGAERHFLRLKERFAGAPRGRGRSPAAGGPSC